MTKYVINGGKTLNGEVTISGAKNAAVAIVPAALLADGPVRIENVPKIIDVTLQMVKDAQNRPNPITPADARTPTIHPWIPFFHCLAAIRLMQFLLMFPSFPNLVPPSC